MKKIVQDHLPKGKWGKMLSLTRLAIAALVLSIGTLSAAPEASSVAQQQTQSTRRTVTGVVTGQNGAPVEGVSVTVRGVSGTGTITDANGRYSIGVARGATLEFTHVSMVTQTEQVRDQATIDVRMRTRSVRAEQVIVTAGVQRPKESFTGDARTVSREEIKQAGAGSVVTALRNLDPTFYVAENNIMGSNPNAMPVVTMRGSTSLPMIGGTTMDGLAIENIDQAREYAQTQNQPLVLIDGFISDMSRLVDMDENLIETIVLLKDAAATAMYGTRAANGVINITLRKPEPGTLRVTYTGGLSLQTPDMSSYNLMNAGEKLEYERKARLYTDDKTNWNGYLSLQRLYTQKKIDVERGVDTYWLHYPLHVAVGHNHSLYVDGGDEAVVYSVNGYYNNTPGVMKGSARNNFRGGVKLQYKTAKLRIMNEVQGMITNGKDSPYGTDGAFGQYSYKNQYYYPYDEKGDLKKRLNDYDWNPSETNLDRWGDENRALNPLWDANMPQRHTTESFELRDNFMFEWNINTALTLRGQGSISRNYNRSDHYWSNVMSKFDNVTAEFSSFKGQYDLGQSTRNAYDAQLTLQYNKLLNDVHMFTVGLTGDIRQTKNENYTFKGYGFSNPEDAFLGVANSWLNWDDVGKPSGNDPISRDVSLALALHYIYNNRYFASLDSRVSGSSAFGENNLWAPNWVFGMGWNMHNENFFQSKEWVESARITANYGSTGSQNFPANMSTIMFRNSDNMYQGWGGSIMQGIGNKDLKWETTYTWNLSTDWALFNNRFNFQFSLFNKKTHDLISSVNLPYASGFKTYFANVGKSVNKGFELQTNYFIIRDYEDYDNRKSWNVGLTAGHVRNVLLELSDGLDDMNLQSMQRMNADKGTDPAYLMYQGESRDMMYVKQSLGIDPISGHEVFVDENGNQTFDWEDAKMVKAGITLPQIHGSFYTTGEYKGWRLTVYFHYEMGAKVYNDMLAKKIEGESYYTNMDRRALTSRWFEPGDRAQYKSALDTQLTKATSRFVSKNDFLDLSSIDLSYEVPKSWIERYGIQSMTLRASTRELFHLATVKRERGIQYPFSRTYNFSLNARF
jgi:TonB-linked SusC/RagA family outer membrane protein